MARAYHELTKHSLESVRSGQHFLDWPNQPLAFKIYTSLPAIPLPTELASSAGSALEAIGGLLPADPARVLDAALVARLCYYANGITKVLRRPGGGMPFRAAACTGALYHIELYVACADLPGLEAGVYHYGAHDHSLRQLRAGDYRALLDGGAQAVIVLTSTFWRNAWKYQARAYRHSFWDSGTVLANLLAVANAQRLPAHVLVGFTDADVNELLGVDGRREAAVCLVALGANGSSPPPAPALEALDFPTRQLSPREVEYPEIIEAHAATSLKDDAAVAAWRPGGSELRPAVREPLPETPPIEHVITRRGSSRRFARQPIALEQLHAMLEVATQAVSSDVAALGPLTRCYLIVNAVDGLAPGAYRFEPPLAPISTGEFRREAGYLDLGQELAADAAVNIYSLSDLEAVLRKLGDRGYRAAQLEGAIVGGRLYLAAYALGLGATGLTFFDDDVSRFFGVPDHAVMFLTAIGRPTAR